MSEQREELTIVIPAKNEEEMLPRLLASLCAQDYEALFKTRVLIADAGSTDDTIDLALSFSHSLRVEIIRGGLPAVGRNAGARIATSKYVLFLDADVELGERTLVRRALEAMRTRRLECCTTNIECRLGGFRDDALYLGNNLMQRIGSMLKPFATGMFMMFDRDAFWRLGGFNEQALFAEDYLLSKEVARNRFTHRSGTRVYVKSPLPQGRSRPHGLDVRKDNAPQLGHEVLPPRPGLLGRGRAESCLARA